MSHYPSAHTRLMNYLIGMCKKHRDWISILADFGYDPEMIEQSIRTSTDERVKPDLIATSNKLIHSLVFECKGGVTVEEDQLRRYETLEEVNLLRWLARPLFSADNFSFDVCLSDLEDNHFAIARFSGDFPIITFSDKKIFKTGKFKLKKLDAAFAVPIDLENKIPPLSYYPFSEKDENSYIAPFLIRGLVSVAIKKSRGGPSVFDKQIIGKDELLKRIFNPVYDMLSAEHRNELKEKVRKVVDWLMEKQEIRDELNIIEQQDAFKIDRSLEKLVDVAEKAIASLSEGPMATYKPLTEFMDKK